MAQFPPAIDVVDEATTRQVAEAFRSGLVDGSHQAELLAEKFGLCVIDTLRYWNLDGPNNRFGFGSTAKGVAKEQGRALHQAAEHMKAAAVYVDAWRLIVDGKFWTPVRMAEQQFQNGGASSKVLVQR
jgi:hypothetical protein